MSVGGSQNGAAALAAGRMTKLVLTFEVPRRSVKRWRRLRGWGLTSARSAIQSSLTPKPREWALVAAVLRSSAVRTSLDAHKRQGDGSGRQRPLLKKEAFRRINACLRPEFSAASSWRFRPERLIPWHGSRASFERVSQQLPN